MPKKLVLNRNKMVFGWQKPRGISPLINLNKSYKRLDYFDRSFLGEPTKIFRGPLRLL